MSQQAGTRAGMGAAASNRGDGTSKEWALTQHTMTNGRLNGTGRERGDDLTSRGMTSGRRKALLAAGVLALVAAGLAIGFSGWSRVVAPGSAKGTPPARPDALICLDPGHGGRDPGASHHGVEEKDVNLDIGLRARALLELAGYRVMMTRTTDVDISLWRRSSTANRAGADVFVSIHNNAKPPDTNGTTTYFNRGFREGQRLAAMVQGGVVAAIRRPDRGLKTRGFYVLRNTTMPAALLEGVFLSDEREAGLVRDPGFRQRMAAGVALGIDLYLRGR